MIRRANADDEQQVFKLFEKLPSRSRTDEYRVDQETGVAVYRKILSDPMLGVVLVAEEDRGLLGCITLSYPLAIRCSGHYARIEEYIVDEAARGKGLGTQLLEAAIDEARKMGCFDLQVNNPSDLGKPLYDAHGFTAGGDYLSLKL